MEVTLNLDQIFNNIPAIVSGVSSILALVFATWLKMRNVDIEEKTTVGTIQTKQIDSLLNQITLLSDELNKTREQLIIIHNHNIELIDELRLANKRITELEGVMNRRPPPGGGSGDGV